MKSEKSILRSKSYDFAISVLELNKHLGKTHREYVLARQVLRSGTAIGALIREAEFGQSRADFSNKMSIALKEANETQYWLSLLKDTGYLNATWHQELSATCTELIRMLVATVKTTRR